MVTIDPLTINCQRAELVLDIMNNVESEAFIDFDTAFYNRMSESKAKGVDLWAEGEEEFYRKRVWSKDKRLVRIYNLKRFFIHYLIVFFSLLILFYILWKG